MFTSPIHITIRATYHANATRLAIRIYTHTNTLHPCTISYNTPHSCYALYMYIVYTCVVLQLSAYSLYFIFYDTRIHTFMNHTSFTSSHHVHYIIYIIHILCCAPCYDSHTLYNMACILSHISYATCMSVCVYVCIYIYTKHHTVILYTHTYTHMRY